MSARSHSHSHALPLVRLLLLATQRLDALLVLPLIVPFLGRVGLLSLFLLALLLSQFPVDLTRDHWSETAFVVMDY